MQTIWNKTKNVAYYAAETLGLKASELAQIREKRSSIKRLKEEFGADMFDTVMLGPGQYDQVFLTVFEESRRQIESLNFQIHYLEARILDQDARTLHGTSSGSVPTHPVVVDLNTQGQAQVIGQWVQKHLAGFKHVDVRNFSTSWYNGLAFAALLVNWKPNALNLKSLQFGDPVATLNAVFAAAEKEGVTVILNPDYLLETDAQSILTQVNLFRHHFATQPVDPEGVEKWNTYLTTHAQDYEAGQSLLAKAKAYLYSSIPSTSGTDILTKDLQKNVSREPAISDKSLLTKGQEYVQSSLYTTDPLTGESKGPITQAKEYIAGATGAGVHKDVLTKELEQNVSKEPAIHDKSLLTKGQEYIAGAAGSVQSALTTTDPVTGESKGPITQAKEYVSGAASGVQSALYTTDPITGDSKGPITRAQEYIVGATGPHKDALTRDIERNVSKEPAINDKSLLTRGHEYVTSSIFRRDPITGETKGLYPQAQGYISNLTGTPSTVQKDSLTKELEQNVSKEPAEQDKGILYKGKELLTKAKDLITDTISGSGTGTDRTVPITTTTQTTTTQTTHHV